MGASSWPLNVNYNDQPNCCHFPRRSLAPSHSLSMYSAALIVLGLTKHLKLTGFELNPFVKFQRSGRTCSPRSFVRGTMSKAHRILAMVMNSEFLARCIPTHILRPNPNGNSKSRSRGSVVSRNRSGRNSSGNGNISGSCMIPLFSSQEVT